MKTECPFCSLAKDRIWFETRHSLAFFDQFPLTEGHTLVIPRRHVQSAFDLRDQELADLWSTVGRVRKLLLKQFAPDAFNIGINDGSEAGQTVAHTHVHVIPRKKGDMPDPRGGIRWIMPDKAKYW